MLPNPYGLDFNRNYPYHWRPESKQLGAGAFPLSEPETRAVVEFLSAHQNVFGCMNYHTYSGVLLRPYSDRPDSAMAHFDLAVFEHLGKRCEEHTGFAVKSTYHAFCYDVQNPLGGAFDDWAYEHYGVHAYTMELWSLWKQAGLNFSDDLLRFWRARSEDEDLALLRWNDEELGGEGFVPWYGFEHAQLGPVEIGGWRWMFTWRNAPAHLLEGECHRACLFSLDHARSGPRPRLQLQSEHLADDLFRVSAVMENQGFLPTYVTEHARRQGIVRKLNLELCLPPGTTLVQGARTQRVEHLEGYANVAIPHQSAFTFEGRGRAHLLRAEWIVRGEGELEARWWGDRIGQVRARVSLSL